MSTIPRTSLTTARIARNLQIQFGLCQRGSSRFISGAYVKENDIVLLKKRGIDDPKPVLTKPLCPAGRVHTHRGSIDHTSLIGKEIRDVVYTSKGVAYRIYQPTLAQYITLCPRMATPVYPADANLIVSLLDIHPSVNSEDDVGNEPFEIFEAGTGHGALTLHLARAIHGLNPAPPPLPARRESEETSAGDLATENSAAPNSDQVTLAAAEPVIDESNLPGGGILNHQDPQSINKITTEPELKSAEEDRFEAYLSRRRAVVHTLDISQTFSKHAQKVVRRFRHGLYYHNIDFHVSTIPDYLSSRLATTSGPFLEHTILDLPDPQDHLEIIGKALKPNGILIVFCPSVTQIVDCLKVIREKRLPFYLETALELGAGAGVGGREWDVRLVKPRAVLKVEAAASTANEQSEPVAELDAADSGKSLPGASQDSGWVPVCRPKVGGFVTGGGFLALWRRMGQGSASSSDQPQPVDTTKHELVEVDESGIGPVTEADREK